METRFFSMNDFDVTLGLLDNVNAQDASKIHHFSIDKKDFLKGLRILSKFKELKTNSLHCESMLLGPKYNEKIFNYL